MIDFCGIELEHPIVNGSGTFDAIAAHRAFGDELLERFPFAAFVSKTVTLAPRQGNPPPRLWEVAGGMINSIGLPNKGLHGYLEHDLPKLARLPVPLIVNVMGFSREEVAELVIAFSEREEVSALELNVSCPNVETGLVMGADPGEVAALLRRVRPLTAKPLIVKLTPNASDVPAVARAAEQAGADALSLINTIRGMALDPATGDAVARRRHRRRLRSRHPRDRARAGQFGVVGDLAAVDRDGRRPVGLGRPRSDPSGRRSRRGRDRELPRSGGRCTRLHRACTPFARSRYIAITR